MVITWHLWNENAHMVPSTWLKSVPPNLLRMCKPFPPDENVLVMRAVIPLMCLNV